jgi:hypothetical protein
LSDSYQSVLVPGDTSLLVGVGVGVAVGLTGLTAEEAAQVGADLVGTTSLDSVALSAASLKDSLLVSPSLSSRRKKSLPGKAWRPWQSHLE